MPEHTIRGLEDSQIQNEQALLRDTRTGGRKFFDALASRGVSFVVLTGLAIIPFVYPSITGLLLLPALLAYGYRVRRVRRDRLPFRLPISYGGKDYGDPKPGRFGYEKAAGIFFLGNRLKDKLELWLKAKDVLTHMLVFGTTGSGKTEFLASLSFNYLATGSGFVYVDPKAAPRLAVQQYVMSRLVGREDDTRILNYTLSGKLNGRNPKRLGNITNPFSLGSAESLTQLLVALIPASEGDNTIFSNNAQTLVSALMYALVELRDRGELQLSIARIRDYMALQKYVSLAERNDLSPPTLEALRSFLRSMGWQDNVSIEKQLQGRSPLKEQYGYAVAYFNLALAGFTDTYGHIYLSAASEVAMDDIILNRRILVTLLPALEMAPQQLKNTGQIVLSSVRNACAVGLGDKLQGEIADVLDALPTDSPTPFGAITDEYAAIPTPGYAEVLTQGRGLGVSAIVASQDYAGIQKSNADEAQQIVANTKVKFALKMEDAEKTWELFRTLAGEASVMQTQGFQVNKDSNSITYTDTLNANVTRKSRIELPDLQKQIEGEFHAFFNGQIIRGRSFYANPPLRSDFQMRINEMVRVNVPDKRMLEMKLGYLNKLLNAFIETGRSEAIIHEKEPAPKAVNAIRYPFMHPLGICRNNQAICSLIQWARHLDSQKQAQHKSPEEADTATVGAAGAGPDSKHDDHERIERATMGPESDRDDRENDVIDPGHDTPPQRFAGVMAWCREKLTDKTAELDFIRADIELWAPPGEASANARKTVAGIKETLSYPKPPTLKKEQANPEDLKSAINLLIKNAVERGIDKEDG